MSFKPQLEQLEDRCLPSAVTSLNALTGVLTVTGDAALRNVVTVDPVAGDPTMTRVTVNGSAQSYTGLTEVDFTGGAASDDFSNNTAVNDAVFTLGGNDRVFGGAGVNTINPGAGNDVVYALLGKNSIDSRDGGVMDYVLTNDASVQAGTVKTDVQDQLVDFFAPNRLPGSGQISLESGVLYITPPNSGGQTNISTSGGRLYVTYNWNDGTGQHLLSYRLKDVKFISYFGGTGDDIYNNSTAISEAAYGSAGNDLVIGGYGRLSIEKGSGGNDTVVSRTNYLGDVSGNGGADRIVIYGTGQVTIRVDAADSIEGAQLYDLIVRS